MQFRLVNVVWLALVAACGGQAPPQVPPQNPPPQSESTTSNYPSLVLYTQDGKRANQALLGQWLSVPMGWPRYDPGGEGAAVAGFGLMISDTAATFDPDERLNMSFTFIKDEHSKGGAVSTNPVSGDIYLYRNGVEKPAMYPGFRNEYNNAADKPVFTHRVELVIDASKLKGIGIEARATGGCKEHMPTLVSVGPGQKSNLIRFRERYTDGLCTLELRLCSTPRSSLYRPQDACTIPPNNRKASAPDKS